MRLLLATLIIGSAACRASAAEPEAATVPARGVARLSWLSGTWRISGEPSLEEHWNSPWGASMTGTFRVLKGGAPVFYELLALEERGDEVTLQMAHFGPGLGPTEKGTLGYRLASASGSEAAFETMSNDAVRLIRYHRDDDSLIVTLEREGAAPDNLRFARVTSPGSGSSDLPR